MRINFTPFLSGWRAAGWLVLAVVLSGSGTVMAGKKKDSLAPHYRKWLEEEVVYLISKDEREIFLGLSSDKDRDRFIQMFWEARDPTPGTPRNEFREEHYRRFEHAQARFSESGPGWRTDRGRIYIQLGPPAQRFDYFDLYNVYPVDLWFYTNRNHSTLPNNFYVMFWQREGGGDFVLYSPYRDGPEKLVHASFSGRDQSYSYLRSMNSELARASLTLLPSEPVDPNELTPSLESDVTLARIRQLPEQEAPREYLQRFGADGKFHEKVTANYSYQFAPVQATMIPVMDEKGKSLIHYAFLIAPEDLSIGRYQEDYYLSLDITLTVSDEAHHTLLTFNQELVQYYSEAEFQRIKSMPLLFEDKLGAVPGKYYIDLLIHNRLNRQNYRVSRLLEIAGAPAVVPALSPVVIMDRFEPVNPAQPKASDLCFTFFNVTFMPLLERSWTAGRKLNVFYQLYYPPDKAAKESGEALTVEYRIVSPSPSIPPKIITDIIPKSKINRLGSLLNFKQLEPADIPVGRLTLVVALKEPSGRLITSGNVNFSTEPAPLAQPRLVASQHLQTDEGGIYDYHRALFLEKQGKSGEAYSLMKDAYAKSAGQTVVALAMARLEYQQNNYTRGIEILELARQAKDFPSNGNLQLGRLYAAAGRPDEARAMAEAFLTAEKNPTHLQAAELAAIYEKTGDREKAAQYQRQAAGSGEQKPPDAPK